MEDSLQDIARYYDRIMEHVNYDRWELVTRSMTPLLPREFLHVDAACGTGTLLKRLRRAGWRSYGVDLSLPMLQAGSRNGSAFPSAVADLRALPFAGSVHFMTCLFDSINFLLEPEDLDRAFKAIADSLLPDGILYFDAVTERMVTQHFEGQEWVEHNGRFTTTWTSKYSRATGIVDTHIRVNHGDSCSIRERIYGENEIAGALERAGLTLLGFHDAHNWKAPRARTIRIDFVAAKKPGPALVHRFQPLIAQIRRRIG